MDVWYGLATGAGAFVVEVSGRGSFGSTGAGEGIEIGEENSEVS